ncbi:hypothetical protein ACFXK0_11665 [Nocardia sp. NPDC059177]|uniref:hypothetical protein n=1 Tax=Nocardia sp. NPDC059177 TaxID=3346759 RepID=UPI00369C7C5D
MTSQRLLRFAVLAGTACAAMALAMPAASAVDLAPGVWCDGAECVNDNDEAYVVYGTLTCVVMHTEPWTDMTKPAPLPTQSIEYQRWSIVLAPHGTGTARTSGCFGGVDIDWDISGAYPQSRPPTGSAG